MKFPNIDELGLNIRYDIANDIRYVPACDLESLLSKGFKVSKNKEGHLVIGPTMDDDTHSGLLIGYAPIPKLEPVSKEELRSFIENAANTFRASEYVDFLKRIEKAGIK